MKEKKGKKEIKADEAGRRLSDQRKAIHWGAKVKCC